MELPLTDAGPQDLYAAHFRAAPEAADLAELGTPIRRPGAAPDAGWGRLSALAADICADLCGQLAEHAGVQGVAVSTRGGTYHVLTRVHEAVVLPAAGDRPAERVTTADGLLGSVGGSLLSHPVRHGVSAVAEWVRYRATDGVRIAAPGLVEDLVVRTSNTTTIAGPRSPSYMVDALQEAAEFVATLDGLFIGWQVELAGHYYRISRTMEQLSGEIARRPDIGDWDSTYLDETQQRLEAAQHAMQRFVMDARLRLMFITAPSLVTSPVLRGAVDHLLEAAGFPQARADFVATVDDVVGDRAWTLIDASVRRRQELAEEARRTAEARNRRRMDILLAAVAAIGVSGLLSIVQSGYQITRWWSLLLVGGALLAAVVAGAVTHGLTRGRDVAPSSPGGGGGPAGRPGP
jgi:hypothetical protein